MRGLHYGVVAAAVVGLAATAVGSAFGAGGIVKAPTVGAGPIAKILFLLEQNRHRRELAAKIDLMLTSVR